MHRKSGHKLNGCIIAFRVSLRRLSVFGLIILCDYGFPCVSSLICSQLSISQCQNLTQTTEISK